MSAYHEIYFRPLDPSVDAVAVVSAGLGCQFQNAPNWPGLVADLGFCAVDYFSDPHELVNDCGLPFESHPLTFEVRDYEKDMERQRHVAMQVFEALESNGGFSCFLAFDLQSLVAEHII